MRRKYSTDQEDNEYRTKPLFIKAKDILKTTMGTSIAPDNKITIITISFLFHLTILSLLLKFFCYLLIIFFILTLYPFLIKSCIAYLIVTLLKNGILGLSLSFFVIIANTTI